MILLCFKRERERERERERQRDRHTQRVIQIKIFKTFLIWWLQFEKNNIQASEQTKYNFNSVQQYQPLNTRLYPRIKVISSQDVKLHILNLFCIIGNNERKSLQAHLPQTPTLLANAAHNECQCHALVMYNRTENYYRKLVIIGLTV